MGLGMYPLYGHKMTYFLGKYVRVGKTAFALLPNAQFQDKDLQNKGVHHICHITKKVGKKW